VRLAATLDWECENMDVDTAFLNAPVSETIFVEQPEGFVEFGPKGQPLVCKMKKSTVWIETGPEKLESSYRRVVQGVWL